MKPPPKLTLTEVDSQIADFYKNLIPAEIMLEQIADLYWLYGNSRYEATVRGSILAAHRSVLEFQQQAKEFWAVAPELLKHLNVYKELTEIKGQLNALGYADEPEYQSETSNIYNKAKAAITQLETIKEDIDQFLLTAKIDGEKQKQKTGAEIEKLRKHIKLKINGVSWGRKFSKFIFMLFSGWAAWKLEELSGFIENYFNKQSWLPSPFKEHLIFFALFYLIDIVLDKPKDWLSTRLQRNLLARQLGKLWILTSEDEWELKQFCAGQNITKEELDQILRDRLWDPKPITL